jgi:UDP-glucose 4-epimerase
MKFLKKNIQTEEFSYIWKRDRKNKKMKATVVGGSGFIGSHVCDHLSHAGYDVVIYDQIESPWLKPKQKIIIGDLMDLDLLGEAIKGAEIVFNFAAISDLNQARDKPIDTVKINILGNLHVLETCRLNNVKRFIYASTVYVYSREGSFYRCSKQSAEQYVEEYQKRYGLNYTILRFGSLYGPRSDSKNGLYRIVKEALQSGRISYAGSSDAIREYIHVDDAASACVKIIDKEYINQSIVLTGQEPMRVSDLLKMLAEILGKSDCVDFVEERYEGHYVKTPYAYISKIGKKFVPSFHVDLGQGLLELINEVQSKLNYEDS